MASKIDSKTHPVVVALKSILERLRQMNRLWHKAEESYFDPPSFRISLQNCITTARTVTFILQSHKAAIPGFEEWYRPHTERFASDHVMRWAVKARNKIEKQGDLETLSQVRAELVAAYALNPITSWLPAINATPELIRLSIPPGWLDEHVISNGLIAIERRWVDAELPEYEVLDALAHVYGQLALLVVSLHDHLGLSIPPQQPEMGEHLIANLLPDGRLKSMERPSAQRKFYTKVSDGASVAGLFIPTQTKPEIDKKARKKYAKIGDWASLNPPKTFEEFSESLFGQACKLALHDNNHLPFFFLFKGLLLFSVIGLPTRHRRDKYLAMHEMAERVRATGADGVMFISEAWTAHHTALQPGQFPADVPNRRESLCLWAAAADGFRISFEAEILRKKVKKHKIKKMGPTKRVPQAKIVAFAPILEVWGRLDDLELVDQLDSTDNLLSDTES